MFAQNSQAEILGAQKNYFLKSLDKHIFCYFIVLPFQDWLLYEEVQKAPWEVEEIKMEKAEVSVAKTDTEEKLRKSAAKVTVCCFRSLACNSKYRVRFFLLGPPLFVEV